MSILNEDITAVDRDLSVSTTVRIQASSH